MHGQTLNAIEAQLRRIQGRVRQLRYDAMAEGKGFGAHVAASDAVSIDPAARAHALRGKLQPLLDELLLLRRSLATIEASLDFRERKAMRLPREFRYRERQSIASTRTQQGRIYQLLTEIIDDLLDIWGDRAPTAREIGEATVDAVMSFGEQWKDLTSRAHEFQAIIEGAHGPSIRAHSQMTLQNFPFETLAMASWIIVYALTRRR